MSYFIVNKPLVTIDIEDIVDYYKAISPNLAHQFLDRIEEAKKYISNNPDAFQTKYKNVRTILLKQFPYHIHYILEESKQKVVILSITHAYKNPKDYSNR